MTPQDIKSGQDSKGMARVDWDALPYGGDLYGEMHLAESAIAANPPKDTLFPGLAICGVAAAAAAWLSEHYGFPIILLGLLVGLSLNFIARDPRTHLGLDFASRTCLRIGIVILGLQVTFAQIGALGPAPFGALVVVMGAISASIRPVAWASAVRCWDCRAYSSWASRLIP